MKIFFEEQDLIDSVCVFTALRHGLKPENLQVELFFEEQKGFSAVATSGNGMLQYRLNEQDLIDSVAVYLRDYHRFDPHRLTVELFFEPDKGFWAIIEQAYR
jgi:hypothetical protein